MKAPTKLHEAEQELQRFTILHQHCPSEPMGRALELMRAHVERLRAEQQNGGAPCP